MTGTPEPYVPDRPLRADRPARERPWPPPVYVPPSAGAEEGDLARRLRRRLEEPAPGAEQGPPTDEDRVLAALEDPDLRDAVLGRLASAFRPRRVDRVAALDPAGWLLAAPLADRTEAPLLALRTDPTSPGGDGDVRTVFAGRETGEELRARRVLLVAAAARGDGTLRAAARSLERSGATVVGVAALAAEANADPPDVGDDYITLYSMTL